VLNAFRRHGVLRRTEGHAETQYVACSTPFGITEFCGAISGRFNSGFAKCSTPFGITEFAVKGNSLGDLFHVVLNAFRHHGVLRSIASSTLKMSPLCSTPFGITEFCGLLG